VERRRGRRDNGLDAADYAVVGDLDPRVAEHLLDLLGARGIAAYLQPSMDVNPITRDSTVPARPTDRVYADRAHLGTAREHLRRLLAEESAGPRAAPPPVDTSFEGIVAGFDRPVDPSAASWPEAENLPGSTPGTASGPPAVAGPPPVPVDARHLTEPSLLDGLDTFGADLPDREPDEQFVPPPPPPLPRLSRQAVLGGLAILVGLVLLLGRGAGPFDRSQSILLGFAAILGGAVALILRLRPGTDPDESRPPDDGAQV
jgi:hypothetical protein